MPFSEGHIFFLRRTSLIAIQPAYLAEGEFTCDGDFTSRCPFKMPSLCSSVTSPLFHHPQPHLQGGTGQRGRTALLTNPAQGAILFHCLHCSQHCFNLWANMHCALNARAAFCCRACSAHLDFGETVKSQSTEILPVLSHDLLSSGDWGNSSCLDQLRL